MQNSSRAKLVVMKPSHFSDEQIEEILRQLDAGKSVSEIVAGLGVEIRDLPDQSANPHGLVSRLLRQGIELENKERELQRILMIIDRSNLQLMNYIKDEKGSG